MKKIVNYIMKAAFITVFIATLVFVTMPRHAEASGTFSASVSDVKQTEYFTDGFSVSWTLSYCYNGEVSGYNVYIGSAEDFRNDTMRLAGKTSSVTYSIHGLDDGKSYYVRIKPYDNTGKESYGSFVQAETIPTSVKNFKQSQWWYFAKILDVEWDRVETADTVIISLYNSKGKRVKTEKARNSSTRASFYDMKDEVYTVTIQAEKTVNGKTHRTAISSIKCFNQARINGISNKNGKLSIRWGRVGGASGYDVFVSTKPKTGYKKAASVGSSKNKVTVSRLNGKKIKAGKKYYIYVETKKKTGKRIDRSGRLYYWDSKTCNYGYF